MLRQFSNSFSSCWKFLDANIIHMFLNIVMMTEDQLGSISQSFEYLPQKCCIFHRNVTKNEILGVLHVQYRQITLFCTPKTTIVLFFHQ
jgi:hypothetical protein